MEEIIKELYLVRHGQTAWNEAQRFQGQSDIPLSERGRAQARALAEALRAVAFDRIMCSDLRRAVQTAQTIAAQGAAIECDARLRERSFGAWEGLTWAQIVERFPAAGDGDWSTWYQRTPEGGEAFEHMRARVRSVLDDVRSGVHKRVLLVSHAGALRVALGVLFGGEGPAAEALLQPTSVTRVVLAKNGPELAALNDSSHL